MSKSIQTRINQLEIAVAIHEDSLRAALQRALNAITRDEHDLIMASCQEAAEHDNEPQLITPELAAAWDAFEAVGGIEAAEALGAFREKRKKGNGR